MPGLQHHLIIRLQMCILYHRILFPLLLMLALLNACGNQGVASVSSVPTDVAVSASATAAPVAPASPTITTTVQPAPMGLAEPSLIEPEMTPQLPTTVTGLDGELVTIESVERLISLNGDITEIIFALDMGNYLVGVDVSASYPPEGVQDLPRIGYQRQLNAEGLLSLNPTLVIGDEAAGPPEVLSQIRSAGVPVALVADPPTLESPLQKVRFVAQALGVPQRGERLIAQIEQDIATARALRDQVTDPAPRVLFLYLRGTSMQAVAGSNTPADTMITAAGGINVGAEVGIVEFEALSPETVIAAQPDILLVLEKGLESVGGEEGLLNIPGLAETPAGRNRRIVAMDDLYLLGLGPRTGQALADLVTVFHAEGIQAGQS